MRSTSRLVLSGAVVAGGFAALAFAVPDAGAKTSRREALVELGRRLFMDKTASRLGRNSCASCHDPERAFSDPRRVSPDDVGETRRHSQTLLDLTGEGFHWDGEFRTVRELLVARVAPPDEANDAAFDRFEDRVAAARRDRETTAPGAPPTSVPGTPPVPQSGYGGIEAADAPITPVADRLAEDGRYAASFTAAFGDARVTTARVLDAMDAYCASIKSTPNAFDRFLAGDDGALTDQELRGLVLFEGRAGCAQCHVTRGPGGKAPLTDGKFHDTGVAFRKPPAPCTSIDGGRGAVTFRAGEVARFKTPTLRDVASRGPFMHDGAFESLEQVVRYYSDGGTPNPNLDPAIKRLDLTDGEVADVVALLKAFSGSGRAALGFPARHAAPLTVRVVDLNGKPVSALTIDVRPAGDRLHGDDLDVVAASVVTDDDGVARIERPLATHVLLTSADRELGLTRPIPDSCESQTLIATPRDTISLRVRRAPNAPQLPTEIVVFPGEVGRPMEGCGGNPPTTTLTRIRKLSADEALYAGKAPARQTEQRCTLIFDGGRSLVRADVDLSGGASETIRIVPPTVRRVPPRESPTGTASGAPHELGEATEDRTDRDAEERDLSDRR
jgi:cytochrome c peroxidase